MGAAVNVTFYAAPGSTYTIGTPQTVGVGGKVTKPADPTRHGYTFKYWAIQNGDNYEEYSFDTAVSAADPIKLYAVWTGLPISVKAVTLPDGVVGGYTVTPEIVEDKEEATKVNVDFSYLKKNTMGGADGYWAGVTVLSPDDEFYTHSVATVKQGTNTVTIGESALTNNGATFLLDLSAQNGIAKDLNFDVKEPVSIDVTFKKPSSNASAEYHLSVQFPEDTVFVVTKADVNADSDLYRLNDDGEYEKINTEEFLKTANGSIAIKKGQSAKIPAAGEYLAKSSGTATVPNQYWSFIGISVKPAAGGAATSVDAQETESDYKVTESSTVTAIWKRVVRIEYLDGVNTTPMKVEYVDQNSDYTLPDFTGFTAPENYRFENKWEVIKDNASNGEKDPDYVITTGTAKVISLKAKVSKLEGITLLSDSNAEAGCIGDDLNTEKIEVNETVLEKPYADGDSFTLPEMPASWEGKFLPEGYEVVGWSTKALDKVGATGTYVGDVGETVNFDSAKMLKLYAVWAPSDVAFTWSTESTKLGADALKFVQENGDKFTVTTEDRKVTVEGAEGAAVPYTTGNTAFDASVQAGHYVVLKTTMPEVVSAVTTAIGSNGQSTPGIVVEGNGSKEITLNCFIDNNVQALGYVVTFKTAHSEVSYKIDLSKLLLAYPYTFTDAASCEHTIVKQLVPGTLVKDNLPSAEELTEAGIVSSEDYKLGGWTIDSTVVNDTTTVLAASKTVTAQWIPVVKIAYNAASATAFSASKHVPVTVTPVEGKENTFTVDTENADTLVPFATTSTVFSGNANERSGHYVFLALDLPDDIDPAKVEMDTLGTLKNEYHPITTALDDSSKKVIYYAIRLEPWLNGDKMLDESEMFAVSFKYADKNNIIDTYYLDLSPLKEKMGYTVSFFKNSAKFINGAALPADKVVKAGETFVADLPDAENITPPTDYVFDHWDLRDSTGSIGAYDVENGVEVDRDLVIRPAWASAVTVTFNYGEADNKDDLPQTDVVRKDTERYEMPVPTKAGFALTGWTVSSTDDAKVTKGEDGLWVGSDFKDNVTLSAVWSPVYTVTVIGNGAKIKGSDEESKVILTDVTGTPYSVEEAAEYFDIPTGMKFVGWKTGTGYNVGKTYSSSLNTNNVTFTAQWDLDVKVESVTESAGLLTDDAKSLVELTLTESPANTFTAAVPDGTTIPYSTGNTTFAEGNYAEGHYAAVKLSTDADIEEVAVSWNGTASAANYQQLDNGDVVAVFRLDGRTDKPFIVTLTVDGTDYSYTFNFSSIPVATTFEYTATFMNGDAVYGEPQVLLNGGVPTKPATDPEKPNYKFAGWADKNGTIVSGAFPAISWASVTYDAVFIPDLTVAERVTEADLVDENIMLNAANIDTFKTYAGSVKVEPTATVDTYKVTSEKVIPYLTGNTNFSANAKANGHYILVKMALPEDVQNGQVTSVVTQGVDTNTISNPAVTGDPYWYFTLRLDDVLATGGSQKFTVTFTWADGSTKVITLDVSALELGYTYSFEHGEHGTGNMESVTIGTGKQYALPENGFTPEAGYEFDGWKVRTTSNLQPGFMVNTTDANKDTVVTAQWKPITHTVKVTRSTGMSFATPAGTSPWSADGSYAYKATVNYQAAITEPITLRVSSGWYFDKALENLSTDGVVVEVNDAFTEVTISGTPTADVELTITAEKKVAYVFNDGDYSFEATGPHSGILTNNSDDKMTYVVTRSSTPETSQELEAGKSVAIESLGGKDKITLSKPADATHSASVAANDPDLTPGRFALVTATATDSKILGVKGFLTITNYQSTGNYEISTDGVNWNEADVDDQHQIVLDPGTYYLRVKDGSGNAVEKMWSNVSTSFTLNAPAGTYGAGKLVHFKAADSDAPMFTTTLVDATGKIVSEGRAALQAYSSVGFKGWYTAANGKGVKIDDPTSVTFADNGSNYTTLYAYFG